MGVGLENEEEVLKVGRKFRDTVLALGGGRHRVRSTATLGDVTRRQTHCSSTAGCSRLGGTRESEERDLLWWIWHGSRALSVAFHQIPNGYNAECSHKYDRTV